MHWRSGGGGAQERDVYSPVKSKSCGQVRANTVPLIANGYFERRPAKRVDPRPEPIKHSGSIYIGRERLGRYEQTGRKKFKAFDAKDRLLGGFRGRAKALAAIRKAARGARS